MKKDPFSSLFTPVTQALMQKFREEGSELRFVGGAVRDCLLGLPPKDIDFSTPALPDSVMRWVQQIGLQAVPTGVLFGTITACAPTKETFEITTLRRDIWTNGRHASIEFSSSWVEDASRRDFTINALYCDDRGRLYDFFDGEKDLEEGYIRFIGDPQERIAEDFLRILRYFRFWAHFGRIAPNADLLRLLEESAFQLEKLSGERIWKELREILLAARFAKTFWLMRRVLASMLGMGFPHVAKYSFWDHSLFQDPLLRLSLGITSETSYQFIKTRLHLSDKEARKLHAFISYEIYNARDAEKRLCRALKIPQENLRPACLAIDVARTVLSDELKEEEAFPILDAITTTTFPSFPLTGNSLIENGIYPGFLMGEILKKTRLWWISKGGTPTKEECLTIALKINKDIS
ncbi:MAG: CCA tRNA nucleotidyltransferase [Holosporales bacterium]|nr:CCA tRNA nucleotidyltransferase [Holosporales bacterium]